MTEISGTSAGSGIGFDADFGGEEAFDSGLGEDIDAAIASSPSLSSELERLVGEEGYTIERGQPGEATDVDADARRIVLGAGVDDPVGAGVLLADALGREDPTLSEGQFALDVLDEMRGGTGLLPGALTLGPALGSVDSSQSPTDFATLNSLFQLDVRRSSSVATTNSTAEFPNDAIRGRF